MNGIVVVFFFSRSLSCQTCFFSIKNGGRFAIIKFLWTSFLAIYDIFYGIKAMVFSNDNIFGYGLQV